jgi:hypothetical protein
MCDALGRLGLTLHDSIAFLGSRNFAENFIANLLGALFGVLVGFWIERRRARHNADQLYGHILKSARAELEFLRPMLQNARDRVKAGGVVTWQSCRVPAVGAVLISPSVHERAPFPLVLALSTVNVYATETEEIFRRAVAKIESTRRRDKPEGEAALLKFREFLANRLDQMHQVIVIAVERMDMEIKRLGLVAQPDAETQDVSRRLLEVLQRRN